MFVTCNIVFLYYFHFWVHVCVHRYVYRCSVFLQRLVPCCSWTEYKSSNYCMWLMYICTYVTCSPVARYYLQGYVRTYTLYWWYSYLVFGLRSATIRLKTILKIYIFIICLHSSKQNTLLPTYSTLHIHSAACMWC